MIGVDPESTDATEATVSNRSFCLKVSHALIGGIPIIALGACLNATGAHTVTPANDTQDVPYDTDSIGHLPSPDNASEGMPFSLDCRYVTSTTKKGGTWNGIMLGVSTYEDVQTQLEPVQGESKADTGVVLFLNYADNHDWWFVEACFAKDRLSALNVYEARDLNLYLQEWQDLYGEPDSITWADDYSARSVIWAEEGILVVIEDYPIGSARNVMFFSPILSQDLQTSWLFRVLPSERAGRPPGAVLKPTATP